MFAVAVKNEVTRFIAVLRKYCHPFIVVAETFGHAYIHAYKGGFYTFIIVARDKSVERELD
jgi:hypothetical protein